MRRAFKHTGVLLMTAVVGLAMVGAAYALWFEDLQLTATVSTGTFDVDWSCENSGLTGPMPANCSGSAVPFVQIVNGQSEVTSTLTGAQIPTGKAPTCSAGIGSGISSPAGPHTNDTEDANVLTLTAGNLYPYAGCDYYINIHNQGTVPAHLTVLSYSSTCSPNTVLNPCTPSALTLSALDGVWGGNATGVLGLPDATAACADIFDNDTGQVNVGPTAVQLHTSYELRCHIRTILGQVADAEGDTFTVSILIRAHQWNESLP